MTKKSMQLCVAASILAASFLTFSFAPAPKDKTNGGGIAGGVHFNYTAVENGSGIVGHFTWDGMTYGIDCVTVDGNTATIYLDNNMVVIVEDSKSEGDRISEMFVDDDLLDCSATVPTDLAYHTVTEGNLTVHK